MKIVIAGGHNEADFLIRMFKKQRHTSLVVINAENSYCRRLSSTHNIPVYAGDPSKTYVLSDAGAEGADVAIALTRRDSDNFVICQLAKKMFGVKKTVCIVHDPKNVEVFKSMGVDTVISSTYLVAQTIERASSIENLIKTLSVEDEKIVLTELKMAEDYALVGKALMDFKSPVKMNVSCIMRKEEVIIPDGRTVIEGGDTLVIISTPKDQAELVSAIQKRRV